MAINPKTSPKRLLFKPSNPVSPIMERLLISAVHFLDMGGWLFPDNPWMYSLPNWLVVRLTAALCQLWGPTSCFVAANTAEWGNREKDLNLLVRNNIYERTGLIHGYFYDFPSPVHKGPEMKRKIKVMSKGGTNVLSVLCDNRVLVARFCPKKTHSIIYRAKDADEPENAAWLATKPPRVYLCDQVRTVANKIAKIHLRYIRMVARCHHLENEAELQEMYRAEVTRVISVFRRNGFLVGRVLRGDLHEP